jgi:transcription-repair coupling factor (superfamily II helicase)
MWKRTVPPKIYISWDRIRGEGFSKAKTGEINTFAFNLIPLYMKRRLDKGFQFALITCKTIESSFIYEDTPDQSKYSSEVKTDMEAVRPVDHD